MAHNVSEKTKRKQGRGKGHGSEYLPYIRANEVVGHKGTNAVVTDWITKRQVHLLSMGELYQYYLLRWNDDVIDVREQYPLPLEATIAIAESIGEQHPRKGSKLIPLTTDFLVDYHAGKQKAVSVKVSKEDLQKHRSQMKNVLIEAMYWESIGVPFRLVYKNEMNKTLSLNIQRVVYFWDLAAVKEKVSLFKHLVAHKYIDIDMETDIITNLMFRKLADLYIPEDSVQPIIKLMESGSTKFLSGL